MEEKGYVELADGYDGTPTCPKCGFEFDRIPDREAANQECPNCNHRVMRHDTFGQCMDCECDKFVTFAAKQAEMLVDWAPRPEYGDAADGSSEGYVLWVDQAGNLRGADVDDVMPLVPWFGYEHVGHMDDANLFEADTHHTPAWPDNEAPSEVWDGSEDEKHPADTEGDDEHLGPKSECPICSTAKVATNDEARDWDMDPALRDDESWLLDVYPVMEPITVEEARAAYAEALEPGTPERIRWDEEHDYSVTALKHDEPEPALPIATGDEDEDDDLEYMRDETRGRAHMTTTSAQGALGVPADVQQPAWLAGGSAGGDDSGAGRVAAHQAANREIAGMAALYLKEGAKVFTQMEQQAIINEAPEARAGNLASMDLTGTHYGPLADVLEDHDTDEEWLL
jgi:hypothetical protein